MTKDTVLAILLREQTFVSGEMVSRQLGISRAAVHAAISALREDGYGITSVTNRGYRLETAPDRIGRGELSALLPPERMEHVLCLDTVGSTNEEARRLAREGAPAGQVVLADAQTAGRGRLERRFESPGGRGIYLSVVFRPETLPADTACLTAWTAVAAARAIRQSCGTVVGIKWVNDLVLNRKKIAGILTELSVEAESGRVQSVVIGIGINANNQPSDFSPAVTSVASSLAAETGRPVNRAALAACLIGELDTLRRDFPNCPVPYLEAYRAACVTTGQEVAVLRGDDCRRGIAEEVTDSFGLRVRYPDGSRETVTGGEVSVRGLYGYV